MVAILALEALALVGIAIGYAAQLGQPGPVGLPGRLFLLAVMLGAAAWQGWVGWSFAGGKAWTRAAIVVWQIFQIILAVPLISPANDGMTAAFGWALLVPAAAGILLVFSGSTMRHLAATEKLRRE
ncbi:hypothetical protein GCM10008096_20910 [Zhihengliuella salsuginis]|uniref:Uncharacterized protein n=1 Tax=Zhihengliuella salsuginis TaxID=578222 RepID=A0ABQ3GIH4_9MICC|nr:hypothetical protein GCM10008096_20910 [Zhihengliuella salsuginis]